MGMGNDAPSRRTDMQTELLGQMRIASSCLMFKDRKLLLFLLGLKGVNEKLRSLNLSELERMTRIGSECSWKVLGLVWIVLGDMFLGITPQLISFL
jgi:hypothetical protein